MPSTDLAMTPASIFQFEPSTFLPIRASHVKGG
jgi:hypothetical protein